MCCRVLELKLQSVKRCAPFAFYLKMLDKIRRAKLLLAKTIRYIYDFDCRRSIEDLPVYFPLTTPPMVDEYGQLIAPKTIINYSLDMPAYHKVYDVREARSEAADREKWFHLPQHPIQITRCTSFPKNSYRPRPSAGGWGPCPY